MTDLHREFRAFEDALPSLLVNHSGEFVVIRGTEAVHFSSSYEQALTWAYETFGLGSFFVKKVGIGENVAHFTRDLGPCRP